MPQAIMINWSRTLLNVGFKKLVKPIKKINDHFGANFSKPCFVTLALVFQEPAAGHYDRHPAGDRLLHPHEHLLLHRPLQVRPAPLKRRRFREYTLECLWWFLYNGKNVAWFGFLYLCLILWFMNIVVLNV